MPRYLAVALTLAALAWCAILIAAPLTFARDGPRLTTPSTIVYAAAGRICHQRPERSFSLAGVQQPVCARCFGLYVSGAIGALLGWAAFGRFRRPSRDRVLLLAAAVPTALTFSLEFAGLLPFSNASRFAAALPLGLTAGWVFVNALRDEVAHVTASVPRRDC